MNTLGIIGGMGPRATAELYMAVVSIFQRRFGARYDADFPPILIHSVPAPEVVERLEDERALGVMLAAAARGLEAAGARYLAIACNTAHIVYPQVVSAVGVPVLDLPGEVARALGRRGLSRVGLLATGLTLDRGLYRNPCARLGIDLVEPDAAQRERLTEIIMAVLAGGPLSAPRGALSELLEALAGAGAEAAVLGCTDLAPLIRGVQPPIPVFDSTEVLAEALVRVARGGGSGGVGPGVGQGAVRSGPLDP
jgi:aspartate racemase